MAIVDEIFEAFRLYKVPNKGTNKQNRHLATTLINIVTAQQQPQPQQQNNHNCSWVETK